VSRRLERGRVDPDRLPFEQLRLDEPFLHPRKDDAVRLQINQAPSPRNRRVIGWGIVHRQTQKTADRQRIHGPPRDPAFRVDALEVAEQQQPEVATGRQARSSHRRRIETLTELLDEPIKAVGIQQRIQPRVERMARRLRQVRGDDPQRRLLAVSNAHGHMRHCSTTARFWLMIESTIFATGGQQPVPTFTTGC
jgi:hypothetical protein